MLKRSPDSLAFQDIVLSLQSQAVPLWAAHDLTCFGDFAPWVAIAEPLAGHRRIEVKLAGSGFFDIFGRDLVHSDYLDLVLPEIREGAYVSARMMLDHPCGLWQQTPFFVPKAGAGLAEYTVFPIADEQSKARQLVAYISHPQIDAWENSQAAQIMSASEWGWINIGHGVPGAA